MGNLRFRERDICHLSACDSGDDSVKESRRGCDFMKKFMPIIYVIAFVIGIIFIVTADTGLITSYYPALIAGIIISCFAGVFLAIYLYAWHKQSK